MPLSAMACGPTGLECMKAQWANHGGQDLGMVGIGSDFVGPPEPIMTGPPSPGQFVAPAGSSAAQTAAAIAAARAKNPKGGGGGGSSALDWFNAVAKAGTEIAPVVLNKNKKPVGGGGGGGGTREETPWATYAMIGGGVLIAGVAVFAIIKSTRSGKK